jgi:chemotaxis response regulator CheB
MSELTELIKEAAKRKKKKQLSALKKHYRTAVNWIKKHPGKATGLGALGAGAGYGGYEAIKHLMNREKKSSLFDENVVNEIADEIVKEASKKLKKRKSAPTLTKTYKNTINWIKKHPGKATGLGALGVGAGYGGYEAIKNLMNRDKKSSILDELSGEIIKEAAKKKKKELSALARAYKWVKKHPGRSAGLGALGVGAGYGGYEAIKHLLNKEKKSSLFDEDLVDELANEIIKQAAEDSVYNELLVDADDDIVDEDEYEDYFDEDEDEDIDEDEDADEDLDEDLDEEELD